MSCILETWHFTSVAGSREVILPDGCQDIIIHRKNTGFFDCVVTDVQEFPVEVDISSNTTLLGIRLKPGVILKTKKLTDEVAHCRYDLDALRQAIDANCVMLPAVQEALDCMVLGERSIKQCAAELGVSLRTLQRLFGTNAKKSPEFWLLLSRARRAARQLKSSDALAEIASDTGYADQAHMTREFKRWFGVTPAQLRRNAKLLDQTCQSGLGIGAIDEHSSMR